MDSKTLPKSGEKTTSKRKKTSPKPTYSEVTLEMMITIVDRKKAEYYVDLIQSFNVNMQFTALGEGTADKKMLEYLGINDSEKAVIFSIVKSDEIEEIFNVLDNKFKTIKNGKGIAYTIPLSSLIGSSVFAFLSDSRPSVI